MLNLLVGMMMIQSDLQGFGPLPSARQLAWHGMNYYAFVHFGPNTFTDKEWGDGLENPKVFAPTDLDTDQWVRTFKDAGMSGVILTVKHHDGFCLWPSKYSTHTVREAGQTDVLKALSESCKKLGLKLGIYLSPWDRNHPKYGTAEYNDIFVNMLEEVLGGKYGDVFEVWFDGANGEGPNGKKQVYDFARFNATVRKLQPKAVIFSDAGPDIRWVGNEAGYAGETNWNTIDRDRYVPGTPLYEELTEGKEGGKDWVPAECDVSIRKGWFWRASEDVTVKSPEKLMDIWLGSVGRGSNLLLNVPPDRRGLISEVDRTALLRFKESRANYSDSPLNGTYSPAAQNNRWILRDNEIKAEFGGEVTMRSVVIGEDIALGQRIAEWRLSGQSGDGSWAEVARGTTIGYHRIIQLKNVSVKSLKFEVIRSLDTPVLNRFDVRQFVPLSE